MACTDIRCGGNMNQSLDRLILGGIVDRQVLFPDRNVRSPCFVRIPNRVRYSGSRAAAVSMAVAAVMATSVPRRSDLGLELYGGGSREDERDDRESAVANNYEKIDGWMRDSVTEIVKNLQKAPLFVRVYSNNDDGVCGTRLETEEAVAEDWPIAKRKWEKGEAPAPEGMIFVEELKDEEEGDVDTTTKAWGMVVQGKGSDCPPACYLLKTSTNRGLGLCCTHFCLVKVSSFRETTSSQLKNCWLMPGLQ